jgi:PilZ domain
MDDRRAFSRHAVLMEGKLFSPDMLSCVDVAIKDLSEQGALLCAAAPSTFPARGYLWAARTGTLFECQVRWRKNGRLFGLRFTDASSQDRVRALIAACASGTQDPKRNAPHAVGPARAA